MKIEKISDNQIRCTLNKDDLVDRELRISELAYGTEKAKALFRDMMQQASYQFGFEAEDIPLMIEAIPVSSECLVLVITKVQDPEELDTRFSKFSPDREDTENIIDEENESYADEILNCFDQLDELLDTHQSQEENTNFTPLPETLLSDKKQQKQNKEFKSVSVQANLTKVYSFGTLENVIQLCEQISSIYKGKNHLYKNPFDSRYYLTISKSEHTPEEFNKVCNIISEYGKTERTTYASTSFYEEHFEPIIKNNAVQILVNI